MESAPLPVVIGQNARRIRLDAGATLNEVAKSARHFGLKWVTARVVELENGKFSPTLPNLTVLALVLSGLADRPVRIHDLVESAGYVELTDSFKLRGEALQSFLRGDPGDAGGYDMYTPDELDSLISGGVSNLFDAGEVVAAQVPPGVDPRTIAFAVNSGGTGLPDQAAARKLGVSVHTLTGYALSLWKRPLSRERDRRAGPDANRRRKGLVTSELMDELSARMKADGVIVDGDD